jgi:REP element-mobilizing transposase RayT
MAPPRIEAAGCTYHVNGKAVHGTSLFRDDEDRSDFLKRLGMEARASAWTILEYSLMTTHFHVLVRINKPTLSSGFRRLNGTYARSYNVRHERRGALWQRRFYDSMIESDSHLFEVIRYIARNAARANLVSDPEDWPWCSYGSAIGVAATDPLVDEAEVLRLFGTSPELAREALRAFVDEPDPRRRRGLTTV